jgi:hypothetical protein
MWGRHSGGDEPKANPQYRLIDQITFKKYKIFWSPECDYTLFFLKRTLCTLKAYCQREQKYH